MELMTERWTDDRMDDLKRQVEGLDSRMEQGFREVRKEIGGLRSDVEGQIGGLRSGMESQIGGLRGEMTGLRSEMDMRFDRLDTRLDTLVYAIVGFGASMFAAMMGLIAVVILSL
jgi:hypothetical protein